MNISLYLKEYLWNMKISYFLLLVASILIGAFYNEHLMYVYFIVFFLESFYKKNIFNNIYEILLINNINALLLPDNYLSILVQGISLIYLLYKVGLKRLYMDNKKWIIFFLIFYIYGICMTVFTEFSLVKIVLCSIYLSSLFICPIIINTVYLNISQFNSIIISHIKIILIIEILSVVSRFICNLELISQYNDLDWVVGTFGEYNSGSLFFFCTLFSIVFLFRAIKLKSKLEFIFFVLSIGLALLTGSIALTLIYLCCIFVFFILYFKHFFKFVFPIFFCFSVLFLLFNPSWVRRDIANLFNPNYFVARVSKIETYKSTFLDFFQDDFSRYMFGTGLGNYSDRTALTCTGVYIDSYNKLFKPIISEPTNKYIVEKLRYVYENKLGTVDTPFSSIISIKGEFGLIGFLALFFLTVKWIMRLDKFQQLIIIFFIFTLFLENYLEFSKILFIICITLFFSSESKNAFHIKENENLLETYEKI